MSITSVYRDVEARTMTITADFDVSVERVWRRGRIPANSNAGGARRRILPPSSFTT